VRTLRREEEATLGREQEEAMQLARAAAHLAEAAAHEASVAGVTIGGGGDSGDSGDSDEEEEGGGQPAPPPSPAERPKAPPALNADALRRRRSDACCDGWLTQAKQLWLRGFAPDIAAATHKVPAACTPIPLLPLQFG
jgi:hypothetical protein